MQGPAPPLQKKSADSPEEQCLEMERKVLVLVVEVMMESPMLSSSRVQDTRFRGWVRIKVLSRAKEWIFGNL